ncbi:MAG: ABC transporter permease [Anaerolineales bacterium]
MKNVVLIIKHEIQTTLSKRSFWVMTFIFPVAILGLNFGTQIIAQRTIDERVDPIPTGDQPADILPIGYIDNSGIVQHIPPQIPDWLLINFSDETSAHTALRSGEIERYFVISADYLESGIIIQVESQFTLMADMNAGIVQHLLTYNLLGDETLTAIHYAPVTQVHGFALAPTAPSDESDEMTSFLVSFAVLFIFFLVITMSSSYMLQSVTQEKENRTAEVLLISLRPRDLMLGKLLGLSAVALFQMFIWLGAGYFLLERGTEFFETTASITLPAGFFVWAILYFFLGFLLYSSLMGAVGTLAPNVREAGSITIIILAPLMLPVLLNFIFINEPDGLLATIFSLFPLTSPVAMITRLVSGQVPFWQPAVGLVALAITTYLAVLVSARFFRSDTLLSSDAFTWKKVIAALRS